MTAVDPDRLARLLPTVYRMRDAESGGALEALLRIVAEQVQVVEDDIAGLYDNWFIETCDAWLVPYLGDLIGAEAGASRRDVANAIGDRRRRGALAPLEQLARDVADWPARAVAFYRLLALAQSIDHLHLRRGRTVDLRDGDALDRLDGPFDELAHTVSVGRLSSGHRRTRYDIPDVGLYVWRLLSQSVTRAPAWDVDREPNHFMFSALTNNVALMTRPIDEPAATHIADELNVPAWIRRRALAERPADYYGPGRSLAIWRDRRDNLVPLADIVAADLSGWTYEPSGTRVAVDPELGRIAFAPDGAPETGVWVTYHHGFSANMGGGEYRRALSPTAGRTVYRVAADGTQAYATIAEAVAAWEAERDEDPIKRGAIIEITDSGVYEDDQLPGVIDLYGGDRLEIRAAQGHRPVLRITNRRGDRPDALHLQGTREDGTDAARVVLDGLLIAGRSVRATGDLGCIVIRHCTLVPGWWLEFNCEPHTEEPSIVIEGRPDQVVIEHTIIGGIRIQGTDKVLTDPIPITLTDSILDATAPTAAALLDRSRRLAHVVLTVVRSTVIGEVGVHAVTLAENTIFVSALRVARRQVGCARYCYLADGSRTPPRYACQPDAAHPGVRPHFNSTRYGRPDYCQLAEDCPPQISRGADDESEIGAFHDLFATQRTDRLDTRLQEFTPAGSSAAIIFAT